LPDREVVAQSDTAATPVRAISPLPLQLKYYSLPLALSFLSSFI
jgi:hypothetical protein